MDLLKIVIKEGVLDFLNKKKKQQNQEIKTFIKSRMTHHRMYGSDHPDQAEVMKFFQSVVDEALEKFGKVCVPTINRDTLEDFTYDYLRKTGLIK